MTHLARRRGVAKYRAPAGGGGGSDPTGVAGLVGWWDGRYVNGTGGTNPSNGTAVATWTDLSGLAHHATQATSGSQPTYNTAGQSMNWTTAKLMYPGIDGGIIKQGYFVVRASGFASDFNSLCGVDNGGAYAVRVSSSGSLLVLEKEFYNQVYSFAYTFAASTKYVISASFENPGAHRLRVNGVRIGVAGTDSNTFLAGHPLRLGNSGSGVGGNGWQGEIMAAAVYTSVHSDATTLQLEQYFGTAFGVTVA